MPDLEKTQKRIATQLMVSLSRLERRIRKLDTDDVVSLYEDGSNLYFHGEDMKRRAYGGMLLGTTVGVLEDRYPLIKDLDLTQPFPLRRWMNGEVQEVRS